MDFVFDKKSRIALFCNKLGSITLSKIKSYGHTIGKTIANSKYITWNFPFM